MQLCPATVLKCQEAIPISNNEMRKIHRGGEEQPARPVGRKVNVSQSRREVHSAAENRTRAPKAPKSPKPPKEKSKHPILRFIGRTVATVLCLGIMLGSVVAVGMVFYVVQATANDGDLLDLDNIQLSQSSMVVATDPDTGAQVEYATLRSSNSHRVWADLEQIPTNLQYAFICTEDKDFYNEPGVNFKRTIGAMVNEYLLPIYSSKQGASTLEQQLIKNLTDDNSASGIEGALRKLREIYRAVGEVEPMAQKRKYLIAMPDMAAFSHKYRAAAIDMTQTYLALTNPNIERRVRMQKSGAETLYFYTEKHRMENGEIWDSERPISQKQYEKYLLERDTALSPVRKTKYRFVFADRRCEIDMYPFSAERAVLFQYGQSSAALPEEITVLREVTGDADYKNRKLAALQKL